MPTPTDFVGLALDRAIDNFRAMTEFFDDVDYHNRKLNDPKGNGTGDDAQSPTGDDYNALLGMIAKLRGKVGG
jgi:hypothetical protein